MVNLGAVALAVVAEWARDAGWPAWGNGLDLARILLYWVWMRQAWRASRNVRWALWTLPARAALLLGLALNVLA